MTAESVIMLGSRSGSAAALAFFMALFGALGYAVYRETRRRSWSARAATVVGVALWAGPVSLVSATALNGFYELHVGDDHLEARFLWPSLSSRISWSDLASVETEPASKSRLRLRLVTSTGERLVSATWNRRDVDAAAIDLRRLMRQRSR